MTDTATAGHRGLETPPPFARRFEAIVFDWDGPEAPGPGPVAGRLRELVEQACAAGLELGIVNGTDVGSVDERLRARPTGPGRLLRAVNSGSEMSARWLMCQLWRSGIGPAQMLLTPDAQTVSSVILRS
jgi:hypothetical protein